MSSTIEYLHGHMPRNPMGALDKSINGATGVHSYKNGAGLHRTDGVTNQEAAHGSATNCDTSLYDVAIIGAGESRWPLASRQVP